MEKLVYLLMGPDGTGGPDLAATLIGPTVAALKGRGARSVQVNVVDPALGAPFSSNPDPDQPRLEALVSLWVDTVEGPRVGDCLPVPSAGGKWHGYLVTESEPLPNTTRLPGLDGRIPGFAQIVPLTRPDHLSWGEWRRIWQVGHTSVAINTQSSFRYVQNVVFRAITPGAPAFAGVVEECFPVEAAGDLSVFFDAVGDDAKLSRHMQAMSDSCDRFMDGLAAIAWTAEYVFPETP